MKIIKDSLTFSSARYVLMGLSTLRNFALAKVLDPENYGYWVILSLVLAYGDHLHAGLRHTGDRDIPFLEGMDSHDEAVRTTRVLFSGVLFLSAIACLGLFFAELTGIVRLGHLRNVLLLAGLVIMGEQISRFSYMILRTRREFVFSSKVEIGFEIVRTALVCVFAVWSGIQGALLAFLFTSIVTVAYFGFKHRLPPRPTVDIAWLRVLLKTGLLLFAVALVQSLLFNIDRVIGSFTLTKSDLGIYGLAAILAQMPIFFSQSINTVFVPNASEAFARRSADDVSRLFVGFLRATAILGPAFCASILLVSKPLIYWFLPAYASSLHIVAILLSGVMFGVLIPPSSALLVITRKTRLLLFLEFIGVLGAVALFSITTTTSLQALSLGMVATVLWHSSLVMAGAMQTLHFSLARLLKEILFSYVPAVYAIVLLFGIFPQVFGKGTDIETSLMSLLSFILLYLPAIWMGYKFTRDSAEFKGVDWLHDRNSSGKGRV